YSNSAATDPVLATLNSGFVPADLGATKISFSASRAAGESASPPTYLITPAASDNTTGLLNNYTVTYTTAAFTINKASLTVTPANQQRQYSDPNPQLTGTVVGVATGDGITASYSTTAGPSSNIGPYPIAATLNDPSNKLTNYTVTLNTATLT